MVQKHLAGEQGTHWDKTNKKITILDHDHRSNNCESTRFLIVLLSFYENVKAPPS